MVSNHKSQMLPPSQDQKELARIRKDLAFKMHDGWGFRGKTFWDWLPPLLQILAALVTSASILIGVYQFTAQQNGQQDSLLVQQHETILNTYLDRMSDLLLSKDTPLGQSTPASPVRSVAQARTITALNTLDPTRQGIIIQFLKDSNLIAYHPVGTKDEPIIHVIDVNLSGINLNKAHLNGVSLYGANLNGANMNGADLTGSTLHLVSMMNGNLVGATLIGVSFFEANLQGANLTGANLIDTDLSCANLKNAIGITSEQLEHQAGSLHNTIMPDGTLHP